MAVKRILVPVDGSELTERAIERSIALAQQLDAAIVGFVAESPPRRRAGARLKGLLDSDPLDPEAAAGAQAAALLARFEAAARAAQVPFEGVCEQVPRIDRAIIAAAESQRCDLIVMVTHGRGAFGEFLFGSQTKAVLAGSRIPLLVLH
jgi:nucleotide-binding universal stress UspA family protein